MTISNLASALQYRYERLGEISDLEEAISYHKESLALRPVGHPDRPTSLNNLASALQSRCDRLGGVADLDEAILYHTEALKLYPPTHPERLLTLSNLALALKTLYGVLGDITLLDNAVLNHRLALDTSSTRLPGQILVAQQPRWRTEHAICALERGWRSRRGHLARPTSTRPPAARASRSVQATR